MIKPKITLLALIFLIILPCVFAPKMGVSGKIWIPQPPIPHPFGHEIIISGEPADNITVIIQNLNTTDKIEINTNEKGQYLVDLSNFPGGYSIGDLINTTIYREGEYKPLELLSIEKEGGTFSRIEIEWETDSYNKSTQCVDILTLTEALQKQNEDIIYQSNIEADKRIIIERKISIGIALLFFLFSFFVTRYYAIKYGNKNEFKKILKFKDVCIILILPIISLVIYLLPINAQQNLKLNIQDPKIWQFITASFTHSNFGHLLGNVVLYLIIILLLLYLSRKAKKLKQLNNLLIFTLITLPIISSILNWKINLFDTTCGTSGLVSAVIGFIPIIWIKSVYNKKISSFWLMCFFAMYLPLILTFTFLLDKLFIRSIIMIVIILLFMMLIFIWKIKQFFILVKNQIEIAKKSFLLFYLSLFTILLFILLPIVLFPMDFITASGDSINLFGHYVGALYGVIVSFYFLSKK